jgi:hypothetical protein
MGEPLKNHFGAAIPRCIAEMISNVWAELNATEFVADALRGYEPLALKQRAEHIARVMHRHLPQDFAQAAEILLASLGPKLEGTEGFGMAPFLYMPHVICVAEHGADHFEESMRLKIRADPAFLGGIQHSHVSRTASARDARETERVGHGPESARATSRFRRHRSASSMGRQAARVSARPNTRPRAPRAAQRRSRFVCASVECALRRSVRRSAGR